MAVQDVQKWVPLFTQTPMSLTGRILGKPMIMKQIGNVTLRVTKNIVLPNTTHSLEKNSEQPLVKENTATNQKEILQISFGIVDVKTSFNKNAESKPRIASTSLADVMRQTD